MALTLPNGFRLPSKPSFVLCEDAFDAVSAVWWLYENSVYVGVEVFFRNGTQQLYDAHGQCVPDMYEYFGNKCIKHYQVKKKTEL